MLCTKIPQTGDAYLMSTSLHFLFILQCIIRRSCQGHQRSPLLINPIVNSHILSYLISTVFDKLSLLVTIFSLDLMPHIFLVFFLSHWFFLLSLHCWFLSSLLHRTSQFQSISGISSICATFLLYVHLFPW